MRWQLNPFFDILRHDFSTQCAVYHEGSGATYLLTGDSIGLFDFFRQTKDEVHLHMLEQRFPQITNLNSLLQELQRMHLVVTVE